MGVNWRKGVLVEDEGRMGDSKRPTEQHTNENPKRSVETMWNHLLLKRSLAATQNAYFAGFTVVVSRQSLSIFSINLLK